MIKLNSLQINTTAVSQHENMVLSGNGNPLICWVEDGEIKTIETAGSVWPPANSTSITAYSEVKIGIYNNNYLLFYLDSSSNLKCLEYSSLYLNFFDPVDVANSVTLFDVSKSSDEVKVAYTSAGKIYVAERDNDSRIWEPGVEVVSEASNITSVSIDAYDENLAVAYTTATKISVYQDPEDYPFPNILFVGAVTDVKLMMSSAENFDLVYNLEGTLSSSSSSSGSSSSYSSSSSVSFSSTSESSSSSSSAS